MVEEEAVEEEELSTVMEAIVSSLFWEMFVQTEIFHQVFMIVFVEMVS